MKNEIAYKHMMVKFGKVPMPWEYDPDSHPYSIGWRMGGGESLVMLLDEWLDGNFASTEERAAHILKTAPPPRWLLWIGWKLFPERETQDEIDETDELEIYKDDLTRLGFSGFDRFKDDFENDEWQ